MEDDQKIIEQTMNRLQKMSDKKSYFAPTLLNLLKSLTPEMQAYYAKMTADALNSAEAMSNKLSDPEFVKYAMNKKKNV